MMVWRKHGVSLPESAVCGGSQGRALSRVIDAPPHLSGRSGQALSQLGALSAAGELLVPVS